MPESAKRCIPGLEISFGQPITGFLRGYNPYELLIEVGPKKVIVFKRAIWDIEIMG